MDVELADPTAFTVYELPETLGWTLPKTFKPDETSEATTVPLVACEMKRTSSGFGWKTVSYRLRVSHKVSSIIGEPPFQFAASLVKLPGDRDDCP